MEVGDETYVIPMEAVVECVELPEEEKSRPGDERDGIGVGLIDFRGLPLPYLKLRSFFSLGGAAPRRENIVVVQHNGFSAGIVVDVLRGASHTVIKPMGKPIQRVPGISGSAILGSGRVALILDVPSLLEMIVKEEQQRIKSS